jgi:hypothetical protein
MFVYEGFHSNSVSKILSNIVGVTDAQALGAKDPIVLEIKLSNF